MNCRTFDVIVIGSGPAGVAAAGALAGYGISVALLEAGVYAGAENWSGCVYFTDSLAAADCYGADAVAAAPFERKITRRGTLMHNGLDVVGLEWHEPATFRNCYTVLRPVYDPYFAHLARLKGAVLLSGTTVTSLIRTGARVVGVQTNRGPLYADVTFIAEGDASHLVRAEDLEQRANPHFLQGVKGVLSLAPDVIEERFGLKPGEGAAYEILVRNPSIGGRTARLNIGAFLYTNRDSISIGYVAPLDLVRDSFRGSHDTIYEWICGLPWFRDLVRDARLSSYGTKLIRSGGWNERPVLVQDGLAVGGSSAGLGLDLPFPNFTGPASATGLLFARATAAILKRGGSFDAKQLSTEYAMALEESPAGRNAAYLSRWPEYFGSSQVLFSRTIDIACGSAYFLSTASVLEAGRFLRPHLLSLGSIRQLASDTLRGLSSLRLGSAFISGLLHPGTIIAWIANLFRTGSPPDQRFGFILHLHGKPADSHAFPRPVRSLLRRIRPALARAVESVYVNDSRPLRHKFAFALREVLRGLSILDVLLLPAYGLLLVFVGVGTALTDAFRFYILKTPIRTLLEEPVMAYAEALRKARDLDLVKPSLSLEAKLATNTYRVGSESHIRTLWPEQFTEQADMARTGLWWICPARVYVYDPPPFTGRGKVTVNYENCIKCESCWRAEPSRTLWGRQTGHKLIYRPESAALDLLLQSLGPAQPPLEKPRELEHRRHKPRQAGAPAARDVLHAAVAFRESVHRLPASTDKARKAWPLSLGRRLSEKISRLEEALMNNDGREQAEAVRADRKALESRIEQGRLFHALYVSDRIEEWTRASAAAASSADTQQREQDAGEQRLPLPEISSLFPDRVVKEWEEIPMPEPWCEKLRSFISEHADSGADVVRLLSSVNPALGLIASRQLAAHRLLSRAGVTTEPGVCAIDGSALSLRSAEGVTIIQGAALLVPAAAGRSFLIIANNRGCLLPLSTPGITIQPTPAIGFRAAGLSRIEFDCTITGEPFAIAADTSMPDAYSYLAMSLGAADYLSKRVKEHAGGRVQFGGQMLDTEGRDGIAKMGAVKSLVARVESWRCLLENLYLLYPACSPAARTPAVEALVSTLAAAAFSPQPGGMGYDAGQVFGGFAYSEDDLLSRSYRDSSLFQFLAPGYGAPALLNRELGAEAVLSALPSLGTIDPIGGQPFAPLAEEVRRAAHACREIPAEADPNLAGAARALVIGIRSLLARLEHDLDRGRGSEAEAGAVSVLLGLAETAVMEAALSSGRGTVPPSAVFPVEPPDDALFTADYEGFCSAPGVPHQSGAFLKTSFDRAPRFVPEMQLGDRNLRHRWAELTAWFRTNCSEKTFDRLTIERFIDKQHRLPQEIISAAKMNKWLATYIPRSLDGLGWRKAEYYILNAAAGSFGDASIDLLIMASTSIGTTPILLGLDEELPRVRDELAPIVQEDTRLGEIGSRLARLINSLVNPNPASIKKEYEAILALVDQRIRKTRVVKYLAANFLKVFYGAGIAGKRGDFNGFIAGLSQAGDLFGKIMPDVRAALDELPRRERCHTLFLRMLGHGAISAFALTEPTAGSDSGGVKTTATLMRAGLKQVADGRFAFSTSSEEKSLRYMIDADRIEFTEQGMAYRTPDGSLQEIRYDHYDYTTDGGARYYLYGGKECRFQDIAQVRTDESGIFYEFYSLTGAKMWITNGSIATQFCLYAQTPEGVTGFLVDRHAEGLKVGADEKKTGQHGSPTNEISIDSARVPREAVIGYEGHGQVNALETLNVGRCGLAVVSGALMRKLLREANGHIPAGAGKDRLLGEAAAVLFGSESLAYYLVGLFDRPHESVRMESAIAKFACSEDIHELITLVEQAYGPEGQTEQFVLEKARRDSRILTIYEGTNEVQRFLILKDLIAQAGAWPELPEQSGDARSKMLAAWKNRLRSRVREAASFLGDTSWSDAMLQPALFPLAEMAGEILRLECIEHRIDWLATSSPQTVSGQTPYVRNMRAAGDRARERTLARLTHHETKFLRAWEFLKAGLDMPEVRTADAALDALGQKETIQEQKQPVLAVPLRVLSIVRPVADLSPRPRIAEGEIRELVWKINSSDLAAFNSLAAVKANASSPLVLDVLMPGGAEHETLLREAAGNHATRLLRLDGAPSAGPAEYVQRIRNLEALERYDVIALGAESLDGDQCLGSYLAGRLGRYHYRRNNLDVKPDNSGMIHLALPAVISITAVTRGPDTSIADWVAGQEQQVKVLAGDTVQNAGRFEIPSGSSVPSRVCTDPLLAADRIRAFAAGAGAGVVHDFEGVLSGCSFPEQAVTAAMLEPQDRKSNLAVLRAARTAADMLARRAVAVIPAPRPLWPALLGLARTCGCDSGLCVDTGDGRMSKDGRRELLRLISRGREDNVIVAGKEWTTTLAFVAGQADTKKTKTLLCSGVTDIAIGASGALVFKQPVYDGRLVRTHTLGAGTCAFVSIADEADLPAGKAKQPFDAHVLDFTVLSEWIMQLPPLTSPGLATADVIIDIGYGIRDSSGMKLAHELKQHLEALGLAPLFGATRKVTQDLKLLPLEAQIGQTGIRVNPKLIIALGISGAPQHIDYVGTRAEILCFNKDNEAPLMNLNRNRPSPRVHPILGDLFSTVRQMIERLREPEVPGELK